MGLDFDSNVQGGFYEMFGRELLKGPSEGLQAVLKVPLGEISPAKLVAAHLMATEAIRRGLSGGSPPGYASGRGSSSVVSLGKGK